MPGFEDAIKFPKLLEQVAVEEVCARHVEGPIVAGIILGYVVDRTIRPVTTSRYHALVNRWQWAVIRRLGVKEIVQLAIARRACDWRVVDRSRRDIRVRLVLDHVWLKR